MCGGSWSFRANGGLPHSVAVLGDHTHAKGYSAKAVKPDVSHCAEIVKETHLVDVSTKRKWRGEEKNEKGRGGWGGKRKGEGGCGSERLRTLDLSKHEVPADWQNHCRTQCRTV